MEKNLNSVPWARKLKLRHLEVLLALHETRNITAAATRLHMTQPALSHWLSDLESVVGHAVFLRNRRLELTCAGEVLRLHAERVLGDVYRTDAELEAVKSGLHGRLHVGTGVPRVLLPEAIANLQATRPGIFVSVVEAPFTTLLEMLANQSIDVIIAALGATALGSGFATEALMPDSVQIVARQGHPCFRNGAPRWSELLEYPWLLPPSGAVMRGIFDAAFAAQGSAPPTPCVEASSSIRAQLLMGENDYLSVLLGSELRLYQSQGLEKVPVEPDMCFPDIGVIWDPDRESPLVSHFLDALRTTSRTAI
ncbi:LysR family transcriptional regulator [Paraburkholderia graminis]|uniref:LysR family transcriptional regulator n=1 Tax=Paraburkholderia graminis TaxID=60548 RepID=UPI0038B7B444